VAEVPWADLARGAAKILVLLRDIAVLAAALRGGLTADIAPRVNLGNVHFGPGRRPVTPSVFLSGPELDTLRQLAAAGFQVEARAIPSEAPAGLADIERRYGAAP
jgi:PTS system mannose-specific IIB component